MIPADQLRRTEVWHEGKWIQVSLGQVTEGDVIRQFEPDGRPVLVHSLHHMKVTDRPAMLAEPFTEELP